MKTKMKMKNWIFGKMLDLVCWIERRFGMDGANALGDRLCTTNREDLKI